MEEMVRQTDQLINFTREVNRRIADSGISGVEGMVALYDQLRGALAKVTPQELEWAQGEVTRVLETLRRLSDELSHLAALKAVLAAAVPRDARRVLELGCGLGLPGFGRALLTDAGRIDTRAFYAELDAAGLAWRASDEPVREEGLPLTVKLVEVAHRC